LFKCCIYRFPEGFWIALAHDATAGTWTWARDGRDASAEVYNRMNGGTPPLCANFWTGQGVFDEPCRSHQAVVCELWD